MLLVRCALSLCLYVCACVHPGVCCARFTAVCSAWYVLPASMRLCGSI